MLDNSGLVGAILMDLWKTYNCLAHDLLIAKPEAYGLDKPSLSLVNDYLLTTWLMLLGMFPRDPF